MFRRIFLPFVAATCFWVARTVAQDSADDPKASTLVDCGPEKVAIFGGTESADGNHAIGWTIHSGSNKKPVDWSSYHAEEPDSWIDNYPITDDNSSHGEYVLVNGVIDLRTRQFTPLASTFPYLPHKNHAALSAAWFDDGQGGWYALVNNDVRWYTYNLWLISVGSDGTRITDLTKAANKAAEGVVRKHDPKRYKNYALTFQASDSKNAAKDHLAKGGTLKLPFSAEIPKSTDDAECEGTVTIALPKGPVIGAAGK